MGGNMLVVDNRLGGPVDIGYPCGNQWCFSVPDTKVGHDIGTGPAWVP